MVFKVINLMTVWFYAEKKQEITFVKILSDDLTLL